MVAPVPSVPCAFVPRSSTLTPTTSASWEAVSAVACAIVCVVVESDPSAVRCSSETTLSEVCTPAAELRSTAILVRFSLSSGLAAASYVPKSHGAVVAALVQSTGSLIRSCQVLLVEVLAIVVV